MLGYYSVCAHPSKLSKLLAVTPNNIKARFFTYRSEKRADPVIDSNVQAFFHRLRWE
jgi:hypothetical protein